MYEIFVIDSHGLFCGKISGYGLVKNEFYGSEESTE